MLDGVLSGKDQKQIGKWEGLAPNRDLLLLHGFQQGTLDLGRGTIDLVCQQDIGEDWPLLNREVAGPLVVDHGADQVRRQ